MKAQNAKCKVCHEELSAILSPFESFDIQIKRIFKLICSEYCEKKVA